MRTGSSSWAGIASIAPGAAIGIDNTFAAIGTAFVRTYIYIDSLTDSTSVATYVSLYSTATNVVELSVSRSGSTYTVTPYYNNFGGSLATFTVTPDTWHRIEVEYDATKAAGSDILRVYLNGVVQSQSTALTFTVSTVNTLSLGTYNGTAATTTDNAVYWDDIAVNSAAGIGQTSYPGEGSVIIMTPNGAGYSGCTSGTYDMLNEVPPSDATSSAMCQLDNNPTRAFFAMTDPVLDAYDTVSLVQVMARIREETAGTSNWFAHISAGGAATTTGTATDAGNTVVRTNPNSTTAFTNLLVSTSSPATGSAWTASGLNALQAGAGTTDGTPDTWLLTLAVLVEYVDGSAPPPATAGTNAGLIIFE